LDDYHRRFEGVEPSLHAFVPEPGRWERLRAAVAAGREAAAGTAPAPRPLAGVPVGVKDIFHVDGLPTRAGSRLPPEALAGPEAPAVSRLRAAGALVAGKTVTTEFAWFEPGPTTNPRAPGRTPGGSSSGSAAAVAAGLCPLALGTQTIGSICRPAAFCAVVGFKPGRGRVPRDGVVPLAPSLDHVGVLAADVDWARRAAALLCDGWRGAAAVRADGPAPVLGVPAGPWLGALEVEGRDHFRLLRRHLAGLGLAVRDVPALADAADVARRHRRLLAAEAAEVHGRWYEAHRDLYRRRTAELVEEGRGVPDAEREAARAGREELRRDLEARMDEHGIDLWLSPAAPGPPPRGLAATGDPVMNLPWTYAGLPVVALPAGRSAEGLPMGIQLTARRGADEELLAWGEALAPVLESRHG
jgi:Asp-tRNA(Asn)/Glu-tRNA(Gln) amidotransferase A subunit family amidase